MPWGTFEKIRQALPNVKFENATDSSSKFALSRAAKKSPSSRKLRRSSVIAIEVLIATPKPGVGENELIAEMLREIVRGGEPITMLLFGTGGPEVPWAQRVFTTRKLKPGDLINTEVEAKYAGYIAQALQPISLGPNRRSWKRSSRPRK